MITVRQIKTAPEELHVPTAELQAMVDRSTLTGMYEKDELLAVMGWYRLSLVSEEYYVWFVATGDLKMRHLKVMQKLRKKGDGQTKLKALLPSPSRTEERFLKFLGMEPSFGDWWKGTF